MSEEVRRSRERWRRIEQIYRQALDLGSPAREALLDEACAGDAPLRHEVESLLACEPAAAGFIEGPALAIAAEILMRQPDVDLIGRQLGAYVIEAWLGSGGMGDVYRARDGNLRREVALKILPERFALDPGRLARFKREAQVLASLNHPNIASIYGFEESDGVHGLALELVEGPTLADRLVKGPIPPEEALAIARQIAAALEGAHERDIVHRDLKPANIKLRPDGTVKVLDFGLAKALEPPAVMSGDAPASPAITSPAMTQMGMILGTAAYMSPEQAKGRQADKRSDIWAFGGVLYEMLSGQRAFKGDDIPDTLAAVLRADPPWTVLPPDTPPAVRRLLHRCLQKDPKQRLQHIGDARLELTDAGQIGPEAPFISTAPSRRRVWPAVAAGAAAAIVGLTAWMLAPRPPAGPVRRFSIQVPASMSLLARGSGIALSPDGRLLVYVAGGTLPRLVKRQLDDLNTEPVRGGEGGTWPFFSPDGAWIGFFADGQLKKVPAAGGFAVTICDAPPNARATWGDDGSIVVARTQLYRVAPGSSTLDVILDVSGDEQFSQPEFLPGSKAVLVRSRVPPDGGRIEAVDLATRTRHPLLEGSTPKLAATGDVLFTRQGRIWATRFDSRRLAAIGTPVPLVESVALADDYALFTVSREGSLAYSPGAAQATGALVWLDRTGASTSALADPLALLYPRLSPDGTRVAASVTTGSVLDLWTFDLARGSRLRLTTDHNNRRSIWSPDNQRIAFFSLPAEPQPGVTQDLYAVPSTGGAPNRLLQRPGPQWPDSWSPDGRFLVFEDGRGGASRDLWLLPVGEEPRPLVVTRFNERGAVFSPNGRWLAFVTDEPGRAEVYVQPFPGPGQKIPVSTNGGLQPVWSRDGRELFYREGDSLMAVPVQYDPFRASAPRKLFDMPGAIYNFDQFFADYDVAADGRFLAVRQDPRTEIHIVLNWTEEVQRALGR